MLTNTIAVGSARTLGAVQWLTVRRAWDSPGGAHAYDKCDSEARSNLRLCGSTCSLKSFTLLV